MKFLMEMLKQSLKSACTSIVVGTKSMTLATARAFLGFSLPSSALMLSLEESETKLQVEF